MIALLALQLVIAAPGKNGATPLASKAPVTITDAYRAVETWPKTVHAGQVSDGLIALDLRRAGIRLRGRVDGVTIRNFRLEHGPTSNVSPDLPAGIAIEAGSGITIENGVARGFRMAPVAGAYTNGDGFSTERPVVDVTFRNVRAIDNSDGGFDLKSAGTRLEDTVAEGNGKNYRFWGSGTAGTITSVDPRLAHVALHSAAVWHIDHLVVRSTATAPVLLGDGLKPGARLSIGRCTIEVPRGTRMLAGKWPSPPTLGPGCSVEKGDGAAVIGLFSPGGK